MKASLTWMLLLVLAFAPAALLAQVDTAPRLMVEDVRCRGNTSTACSVIQGHLHLRSGDWLDEQEVQNAKLRLTSLRSFESADIYLEKGSQKGRVILVIEVVEADPISAEWVLGTSARLHGVSQSLAGRISRQNLFGSDKIIDLTVSGTIPLEDPTQRGHSARLRYIDPRLFDSAQYFALASILHLDERQEDAYGSFSDVERLRLGMSVGRRLWDFSYLTLGYAYQAQIDVLAHRLQRDGTFETKRNDNRHAVDVIYGWNSEDDFYFPTQGSSFHIGFGWDFGSSDPRNELHLQFRKTWQTGTGLWTLKVGGEPITEHRQSFNESQLLSVAYSRPIAADGAFSGTKRGRWYVEPGFSVGGFRPDGKRINEVGLKAGVRLEIDSVGLVDLYVIGSTEWAPGEPRR